MEKIRLEIIGMSYSQSQSGAYALILGEKDGRRRLPIIIGGFEAQAIAIELEKIKTPRPLTHDLFKSFADAFEIELKEIIINKFQEGVFYAQLVCSNGTNNEVVDARTSDAIALALRFNCPIFTYEEIMSAAAILVEEETDDGVRYNDVRDVGTDILPAVMNRKHPLPFVRDACICELDAERLFVCAFVKTAPDKVVDFERNTEQLVGKLVENEFGHKLVLLCEFIFEQEHNLFLAVPVKVTT